MRRDDVGYYCGMAQIVQNLLELLPPGPLTVELFLLLTAVFVIRYLSPVVSSSLDNDFPFPKIAGYVRAIFGVGLPCVIVLWLLSIVVRYALPF